MKFSGIIFLLSLTVQALAADIVVKEKAKTEHNVLKLHREFDDYRGTLFYYSKDGLEDSKAISFRRNFTYSRNVSLTDLVDCRPNSGKLFLRVETASRKIRQVQLDSENTCKVITTCVDKMNSNSTIDLEFDSSLTELLEIRLPHECNKL